MRYTALMAAIRPVGPIPADPSGSPVPRRWTAGTRLVTAVKLSRLFYRTTLHSSPRAPDRKPKAGSGSCDGRRPSRVQQLGQYADDQGMRAARLELLAVADDLVRHRHRQLAVEHPGADRAEHLAELRLSPDRPEHARARADHRYGLALQRGVGKRARDPVERVLQVPRDRVVVLGRGEDDGVGGGDVLLQPLDRAGLRLVLVLVVGRDVLQALVELELDSGRQQRRSRPEELGVVGVPAQAAGYAENPHDYAFASSSSTISVTSFASA